jgi:hypothetical protein
MSVAGVVVHRPNGFFITKEGYEYVLVVSLTCAGVAAIGPGRWSVDDGGVWLARHRRLGWDGAVGRPRVPRRRRTGRRLLAKAGRQADLKKPRPQGGFG